MKRSRLRKLLFILLGNATYAFAIAYFILPIGLITGGTTGIALTIQHFSGLDITIFVSVFNLIMFLIGAYVLGMKFAMTTIVSSLVYPVFLKAFQYLESLTGILTDDYLLCTLFAGVFIGIGIGIVIREGASTGGMDIPPLVINKKTGIPVSVLLNAFDVCILLLQFLFSNREQILYGIVLVGIYTYVLEKVLMSGKSKIQLKIISEKYQEINQAIHQQIDRGTTLFEVEGGYTRNETYAVLTVVSKRELFQVNELVHEIDPDAFIIIGEVKEVRGKGFTIRKDYPEKKGL